MKHRLFTLLIAGALALTSLHADARRMGGGKSFGKQSSNVTQREQARPAATPNAPAAAPNAPAAANRPTNAPAAAQPQGRPWGAMLGGIAAGLGLAWLAHSLGLGEGFGNVLLVLLLAAAAWFVIRRLMAGRAARQDGMAWQGAGAAGGSGTAGNAATNPVTLRNYSPDKVGNDASARPWENSRNAGLGTAAGGAAGGSIIGSALAGSQNWGVPAGFDTEGFIAAARRNFVTLQDAWDRADIATLRSMMTDGMVEEIRAQLAERERTAAGQPNKTEVIRLDAQLLGIEELDNAWMASVEFNGMIREQPAINPEPFREVWNMTKPKTGTAGWLVAGVQALQ